MAKRKIVKEYLVCGKIYMDICISITAESLDNALENAKELDELNFVKPLGDYNDGSFELTGVLAKD